MCVKPSLHWPSSHQEYRHNLISCLENWLAGCVSQMRKIHVWSFMRWWDVSGRTRGNGWYRGFPWYSAISSIWMTCLLHVQRPWMRESTNSRQFTQNARMVTVSHQCLSIPQIELCINLVKLLSMCLRPKKKFAIFPHLELSCIAFSYAVHCTGIKAPEKLLFCNCSTWISIEQSNGFLCILILCSYMHLSSHRPMRRTQRVRLVTFISVKEKAHTISECILNTTAKVSRYISSLDFGDIQLCCLIFAPPNYVTLSTNVMKDLTRPWW
jgi:hypothetical protein